MENTIFADLKNKRYYKYFGHAYIELDNTCPLPQDVIEKFSWEKAKEHMTWLSDIIFTTSDANRLQIDWQDGDVVEGIGYCGEKFVFDLNKIANKTKCNFAFIFNGGEINSCNEITIMNKIIYKNEKRKWLITPALDLGNPRGKESSCIIRRADKKIQGRARGRSIFAKEIIKDEVLQLVDDEIIIKIFDFRFFKELEVNEERINYDLDFHIQSFGEENDEWKVPMFFLKKYGNEIYLK